MLNGKKQNSYDGGSVGQTYSKFDPKIQILLSYFKPNLLIKKRTKRFRRQMVLKEKN